MDHLLESRHDDPQSQRHDPQSDEHRVEHPDVVLPESALVHTCRPLPRDSGLTASDRAPVMNGIMALPTTPRQASIPIAPVCKSPGISSVMSSTHEGYIGPMKTPMSEKQTAAPMSESTNQMTKCSARQIAVLRGAQSASSPSDPDLGAR